MGAVLADVDTLLTWLAMPDVGEEERARAETVVGVISDLARGEARREEWTMEDVPGNVSAIVLMVAASVFGNPDSKTSVTVEEVTRRWEKGDLFSGSQLATLRGFRKNNTGLGTIQFGPPTDKPEVTVPASIGGPVRLYDGRGY
ncbi:hypothetical protein [Gulosibacter faecalis]|uniref:Head-to-tail adaptor n=1 Tax=Gulosibacter faecalis TaxID=272240 RepID=A0ABW5UV37_9MICO|nr:hypothetical protein [Gulosibacter faecalis]